MKKKQLKVVNKNMADFIGVQDKELFNLLCKSVHDNLEIIELNKEIKTLKVMNQNMRNYMDGYKSDHKELKANNDNLKYWMENFKTKLKEKEAAIKEMLESNDKLRQDIETKKEQYECLQNNYFKIKQELKDLKTIKQTKKN